MADIHNATTTYPDTLDTATTLVDDVVPGDGTGDPVRAIHQNGPASAIIAIETELGINPSGTTADVATRLGVTQLNTGAPKTATGSAFTAGSVVFTATQGGLVLFQEDNTNLVWDNTNKRLGVGVASPAHALSVNGNLAFSGAGRSIRFDPNSGTMRLEDSSNDLVVTVGSGTHTTLFSSGSWRVHGVGPHAIGQATDSQAQLIIGGSFAERYGVVVQPTLAPPVNAVASGLWVAPTITRSGSGTHDTIDALTVQPPTITGAGATVELASTLRLANAPSTGNQRYALFVQNGAVEFRGSSAHYFGCDFNHVLTPGINENATNVLIRGSIQRAGSGTHPIFAGTELEPPTLLSGGASVSVAATLKITGAPTGATNNYAIHSTGNITSVGDINSTGVFTSLGRVLLQTTQGDGGLASTIAIKPSVVTAVNWTTFTGDNTPRFLIQSNQGNNWMGLLAEDGSGSAKILGFGGADTLLFDNISASGDSRTTRMRLQGGILGVGVSTLTGASAGDVVVPNTRGYRILNAAGTTSANFGLVSDSSNNIILGVPANTNTHTLQFAGTTRLFFQESNSGCGVVFATESTADHAAPSADRAVLYTKDTGGNTLLVARFNTGAVQKIAKQGGGAIGTEELSTATASQSGALDPDQSAVIVMHDYSFFPNIYTSSVCDVRSSQSNVNNTVGRFVILNIAGTFDLNYIIRWRYITSTDNPHIYIVTDGGSILHAWAADDPLPDGVVPFDTFPPEQVHQVRIADLGMLHAPMSYRDKAIEYIQSKGYSTVHTPYRILQQLASDVPLPGGKKGIAPAMAILQLFGWDEGGNTLRVLSANERNERNVGERVNFDSILNPFL